MFLNRKSTPNTLLSAPVGALKKKSSGFFTSVLGKLNSRFSKNTTTKQQDVNNIGNLFKTMKKKSPPNL
jgi:hypothetical protein